MAEERAQRHLAAILAADVAFRHMWGRYSFSMPENRRSAVSLLSASR